MAEGAKVPVRVEPNALPFVRMHPQYGTALTVYPGPEVDVLLGPTSGRTLVIFDGMAPTDEIFISSGLANQLHIRSIAEQLFAAVSKQGVRFQTVIGILCNPIWQTKRRSLRVTKQLPVLQKFCEAATDEQAVAFVFGLRDVDLRNMKVKGYSFQGNAWTEGIFPLPNVIFDQIVSRRQERLQASVDRRAALVTLYKQRFFNDGFLDKWEVNEWLQSDARTRAQVPATVRYTNRTQAQNFLASHAITYCKPVHGSLGLGIIRVVRGADGGFDYFIRRVKDEPLKGHSATASDVVRALAPRLKARPYVLQQGIVLQQYQSRPFDIRIVLQRDGSGRWKRTKMFARVAEEGQITSNLSSGGEALPVPAVLSEVYANDVARRRIMMSIRRLSRIIPEVLEHASSKQFGELGIDVGVDAKGTVWVIEVNSKPWKTAVTDRGRQDLVDLSFARPMQYAVYLAEHQE